MLRLLDLLRVRGEIRVQEAAELLDVAPSTAHRLLSALCRHGFADRTRSRSYIVGPAMQNSQGVTTRALQEAALPHLERLTRRTQETSHFVVLDGNACRFVAGVDSPLALRVGIRIGLLLPAHTTSGGKVILSHLSDDRLDALYPDRVLHGRDGATRDLAALRQELASVRRLGYALNLEASERGVSAVGVPVRSAERLLGAVVLACPSLRTSQAQLREHVPGLREIGEAIASTLSRTP